MKRLLSIFLSAVLAISMVPAIALGDMAYAAGNSATGEFELSIHRREALAQTNFAVSLKGANTTKNLTLNAAKGEDVSELFETGIADGTYELTISGRNYVTYKQTLDFDGRCVHLDLYNFQTANDGINSGTKLGVIPAGDMNGDGKIDDTDADLVKNAIEKNNTQYDISGDGKVDLDDVAFVVRNAGGTVAATPMRTISNAVLTSSAQVAKSAQTNADGNVSSLLAQNKDGGSVSLSPASGASISAENPVEVSISTKNSSNALPSSQGIVIAPPASPEENYNTISEGVVAVEGVDEKGNTVVYNIPVSADSSTKPSLSLQSNTPLTDFEGEEATAEEAIGSVEKDGEGAPEDSSEATDNSDNSNSAPAENPDNTASASNDQPSLDNAVQSDSDENQVETIAGIDAKDSIKRYAAQPNEVTVENDGTVVINLGSRVAIKKVTIRVTATANQGNLAEIAKVEFLSDFAERVGEPQLSIPTITSVSNTNADGQGYKDISISWTPQTNVTGYEVSVSGNGYNKTAQTAKTSHTFKGDSFNGTIKSFKTYDVKVRSVSGDWRSSWSTVVKHTATCTNKPPAPQYVSVAGQVEALQVKWNCKFDAEWFTLYYKEKNSSAAFKSIANITSTSYPISGLKPGVDYQVYLVAHNRNGSSPKSVIAEGTTLSSTLTGMPKYDLLNVDDANGMAITGIKSISGNSNALHGYELRKANGSSVNEKKATYEDWKAIIDNDSNSYLYIKDWDAGVAYGNLYGPHITLNDKAVVDTFRISPSDKVSAPALYGAKIGYKDYGKNGDTVTVGASIAVKYDSDKHKYYEIVANTPIYSDYFELRLRTFNAAPITIQELKIYNYNSLDNDIAALFTDDSRTMVKDTVTEAQVQALIDRSNTADPVSGELHPHHATQQMELNYAMGIVKNGAHKIDYVTVDNQITSKGEPASGFAQSLSDFQPLGYVAAEGDSLVVYVADEKNKKARGSSVSLNLVFTQMFPEVTAWQKSVALKAGRNEITVPRVSSLAQEHGGAMYLQYTGAKGDAEYKVRVLGGNRIPVLNVNGTTGQERTKAIANYVKELKAYCNNLTVSHKDNHDASENKNVRYGYNAATCILNNTDICMDNMMYSFPATQVNASLGASATDAVRASKLEKAIEAMETQMDYFYQFKGLHKKATDNDRYPKLRNNIRYHRMFTGAFMYAAGKHIGIGWGSVGGAFSITPVKANAKGQWTEGSMTGWGISHEIGHCINAAAYQRVEVTNNVFAQLAKGASQNGETSAKFRANYNNVYKGVAAGNVCHNGDLKVQLAQYWQLHLAYDTTYYSYKLFDETKDQQDNLFYARMESYLRTRSKLGEPFIGNPSGDQLFMQAACAAANKNILEFFTSWGYQPNADTIKYANKFITTESRKIQYVNDDARLWKLQGKSGMSSGTIVNASITNAGSNKRINGNSVKISLGNTASNQDAMLGYEIKRNGKIVGFVQTPETSFTDILTTENNKVFNYEVTGIDKLLNTTKTVKLGEVKICHDGAISKANWTATSTTATSKQDTDIVIKNDEELEGDGEDGDGFDPDAGTVEGTTVPGKNVISAAKNVIDYDNNTIFCAEGGKTNRPNIVINLGGAQQVTALKYTPASKSYNGKASNTLADNLLYQYRPFGFKIELSKDGTNWSTVKEGNLYKNSKMDNPATWIPNDDIIVNNDSNVNENKSITIFFSKPDSDSLQTYDAGYVRFTATNMTAFATAEIDILGPTSDNVELTPEGYGRLASAYPYGNRIGDVIPAGARVMYGEYKGDPSYNVVILKDQNGKVIDGQFVIMANVPAKGKLGETSNGRWIFWMEDKNKVDDAGTTYNELQDFKNRNITSVQAELYRVQDAFTLAGQRLTSNSLSMTIPAESEVKSIRITTDNANSSSLMSIASAAAAYSMRNEEGVDHNGVTVFDQTNIENSLGTNDATGDRVILGEDTPMAAYEGTEADSQTSGDNSLSLHSIDDVNSASASQVVEMFGTSTTATNITQAELKYVNGGYAFRVNPSSIAIASEGVFKFDSLLPATAKVSVKGLANAKSTNATYNGSYIDSEGKLHVFVVARSGILSDCSNSQAMLSFTGSISGVSAHLGGAPEYIKDINGDYGEPVITDVAEGDIHILADMPTQRITSVTLSPKTFAYNKKTKTPKVIVKSGKTTLKSGRDYTVSYASGRKKIGAYKVKVTGINSYTGSKTVSFQIVPKGTTLKSVKGKKKSMVVSFKKQVIETTGYKVRYSLKKSMKGAKSVTIKKNKTTSTTIKKLKSKKTYYVQVATYKKIGKATYVSSWSKAKKVKIK